MAYQAPPGNNSDALLCFICDQPFAVMQWRKLDEDRTAHPNCFNCDSCSVSITGKYHEADDGSFYCLDNGCIAKLFGSVQAVPISKAPEQLLCFLCDQPFLDISWKILDEDRRAHPQCFKCDCCGHAISGKYTEAEDGSFYCVDNGCVTKIYGENTNMVFHIEKQQDPCWICGKELGGTYMVDEDGHKYHNECFKCIECGTLLKDEYFQEENQFWCKECRIAKQNKDYMAAMYKQMDSPPAKKDVNVSPFGTATK